MASDSSKTVPPPSQTVPPPSQTVPPATLKDNSSPNPFNDQSSPYYLHPNESPVLILVSIALTDLNYHTWSRAMKMALLSKNKLKFVDGNLPSPSSTDPLFPAWERCNTIVLSWIHHSLSPAIATSVLGMDSAADVWTDLETRFSHGDICPVADLQEELYAFEQDERTITEYFTELKIKWDELLHFRPIPHCSCADSTYCSAVTTFQKYLNTNYVIRFLKGLNDRYTNVVPKSCS